jgi:uncharacterized membrane protein YhiD involved in acid resistance
MIGQTGLAIGLGIALIVVLTSGAIFFVIFLSAKRADRMRSTRQRLKKQHWSIRIVSRIQMWERRLSARLERPRSRRRR